MAVSSQARAQLISLEDPNSIKCAISDAAQAERSGLSIIILSAQIRVSSHNANRKHTEYQCWQEMTMTLGCVYTVLYLRWLLNVIFGASCSKHQVAPGLFAPWCEPPPRPRGTYVRQWLQWSSMKQGAAPSGRSLVPPTPAPLRTPAQSPALRLEYQTGTRSRRSHPHWCERQVGRKSVAETSQ